MCNWARAGMLAGLALLTGSVAAQDEIVFSTAPTQAPEQTVKLYQPLVDYLSQATGKRFTLQPARNFLEYNNKTLTNAYDMVFDGPHYTGWRMDRLGAVPLARLSGTITIAVVVRTESTVQQLDDLLGKRICAFASPNMLTVDFLDHFSNPVRQPMMLSVKDFPDLIECVKSGRGDAAVVRAESWPTQDQTGLRTIQHKFRSYPERTFSINGDIDTETRAKIKAALLSEECKSAAAGLLASFKKQGFTEATPADYAGLAELLMSVWGFQ